MIGMVPGHLLTSDEVSTGARHKALGQMPLQNAEDPGAMF